MAMPPKIDAAQLGAVIDAFATTNALLFTLLASKDESDAALRLLDRMAAAAPQGDSASILRLHVVNSTATALRGIQELGAAKHPDGSAAAQ